MITPKIHLSGAKTIRKGNGIAVAVSEIWLKRVSTMRSAERTRDIFFNKLRKKEYSRLDKLGHVYLDFTGGNLYPKSLVDRHCRYLKKAVYGNPHSNNPASQASEGAVSEAREKVLTFFNAPDYYCVFTNNASGALKIVGECYPFSPGSHLLLTADNHNSVNGIREYCRAKGGRFTYAPMSQEDLSVNMPELIRLLDAYPERKTKLFAYPAQSNVSGVRHSLSWVRRAQDRGWDVLLDAAAFVPTSKLDLSEVRPDFVALSFYKIFGYPTGIGCLLVKKKKFDKLQKPWYAGGTITLSAVRYPSYFLKPDHEKFEDGTVNYLNIPAITNGLRFIQSIGMENISARINDLSRLILSVLLPLRHDNGLPLIKLYGPATIENRGGTFLLNFFDCRGQQFPFQYIEELANASKISLRTGCFCNPGVDELNHDIPAEQLLDYFTSRNQGDYFDFIEYLGRLRGAVRVAIGIATNRTDMEKFASFARTFLDREAPKVHSASQASHKRPIPASILFTQ